MRRPIPEHVAPPRPSLDPGNGSLAFAPADLGAAVLAGARCVMRMVARPAACRAPAREAAWAGRRDRRPRLGFARPVRTMALAARAARPGRAGGGQGGAGSDRARYPPRRA